jgi:thioredoxin-dependent peroxiredoxin
VLPKTASIQTKINYYMSRTINYKGTAVPDVTFKTRQKVDGEFDWVDVSTKDVFAGKKVVVFSLPGAFTPTCSSTHLPGYEKNFEEFKKLGVDAVYCLSVNDAFVMNAWAKDQGAQNVQMLPDGSGEFTRKMGMLVEKHNLGFGLRSWRYSMLVNDGVIEEMFVEPDFSDNCPTDPFEVSDADTMLKALKS